MDRPTIKMCSTLSMYQRGIQWTVKQWRLASLTKKSIRSEFFDHSHWSGCRLLFGPFNSDKSRKVLKMYLTNEMAHGTVNAKSFVIESTGQRHELELSDSSSELIDDYSYSTYSFIVASAILEKKDENIVFDIQLTYVMESVDDNFRTSYCCSIEKLQKTILDDYDRMNKNEESLQQDTITFVIDTVRIKAHSIILATASPYFSAIFRHENFKENKERTIDLTNDNDVTPENFQIFLDILYGRINVENVSTDVIFQICVLADKYQVNELIESSGLFLSRSLNDDNVIQRLLFADKYNCEYLKSKALIYAKLNMEAVKQSENFDELYENKALLLALL